MNLAAKTAMATGSNTELGFETALDLYRKGDKVYVACRSKEKTLNAIERMDAEGGTGELVYGHLDLSSLASVKVFIDQILKKETRLDLLVNNTGIMILPLSKTEDGFESQFGVNFVGIFALTGQLLNLLEGTVGARVVTLSSPAHRGAGIDFDNFRLEKEYDNWREYGQSKRADLIFALEFEKRLRSNGNQTISLAAHPGYTSADLQRNIDPSFLAGVETMNAKQGAQSTLKACLSKDAKGGQYWYPDGPDEKIGDPSLAIIDPAALDEELRAKLWDCAKEVTETNFLF